MENRSGFEFRLGDQNTDSSVIASAQMAFKAEFDENMRIYGSMRLNSCEEVVGQRFEMGFQMRI